MGAFSFASAHGVPNKWRGIDSKTKFLTSKFNLELFNKKDENIKEALSNGMISAQAGRGNGDEYNLTLDISNTKNLPKSKQSLTTLFKILCLTEQQHDLMTDEKRVKDST